MIQKSQILFVRVFNQKILTEKSEYNYTLFCFANYKRFLKQIHTTFTQYLETIRI
jgi:hypothetical protein